MTNRNTLPQTAVDLIKSAGFRVYMRNRSDSYALYASNDGIGYVQYCPAAGYTVSTVHYPNRESGTGFQVARHISALSPDVLRDGATITTPSWARDKTPRKYNGIDEYRAQDTFSATYTET